MKNRYIKFIGGNFHTFSGAGSINKVVGFLNEDGSGSGDGGGDYTNPPIDNAPTDSGTGTDNGYITQPDGSQQKDNGDGTYTFSGLSLPTGTTYTISLVATASISVVAYQLDTYTAGTFTI